MLMSAVARSKPCSPWPSNSNPSVSCEMMLEQCVGPKTDTGQHGAPGQDHERIGHDRRRLVAHVVVAVAVGFVLARPVRLMVAVSGARLRPREPPGSSGLGSFSGPQKVMK